MSAKGKKSGLTVRKIAFIAMLTAMALVLSIVETFIPSGVPGAKLGLANLVILLALNYFGFWITLAINLTRILLASFCTGTFLTMGFYMSLAGGVVSYLVMYVFHRWFKIFTPVGVSIVGAYFHSLAQICVGVIFMESVAVFYYFPLLALISLATGTINGIICETLLGNAYLSRQVEAMKRGR
jgi:heptaprenyl diphosphate synthase